MSVIIILRNQQAFTHEDYLEVQGRYNQARTVVLNHLQAPEVELAR